MIANSPILTLLVGAVAILLGLLICIGVMTVFEGFKEWLRQELSLTDESTAYNAAITDIDSLIESGRDAVIERWLEK